MQRIVELNTGLEIGGADRRARMAGQSAGRCGIASPAMFSPDTPGSAWCSTSTTSRAIYARSPAPAQADIVIAHVHNHEWDQGRGTAYPADLVARPHGRPCGSRCRHRLCTGQSAAPLRGVSNPLQGQAGSTTPAICSRRPHRNALPADFYTRHDREIQPSYEDVLPIDGIKARALYHLPMTTNPPAATTQGRGRAGIVPVLTYEGTTLARVELHPFLHHHDTIGERACPIDRTGQARPELVKTSKPSAAIHSASASIRIEGGIGLLDLAAEHPLDRDPSDRGSMRGRYPRSARR